MKEVLESKCYSGCVDGHTYVDLGLSINWATSNINARLPYEYGDYYPYSETDPVKYHTRLSNDLIVDDFAGEYDSDAATANYGPSWRTPTREDFKELVDNCNMKLGELNNVPVYCLKSRLNNNEIFFPLAGKYVNNEIVGYGTACHYMTSSVKDDASMFQFAINSTDSKAKINSWTSKNIALPVRPVTTKS